MTETGRWTTTARPQCPAARWWLWAARAWPRASQELSLIHIWWTLLQVRTTNLGSLVKLDYRVELRDPRQEKAFLDELRCRNGNLEISCGRMGEEGLAL